jgi:hypothetical protein
MKREIKEAWKILDQTVSVEKRIWAIPRGIIKLLGVKRSTVQSKSRGEDIESYIS